MHRREQKKYLALINLIALLHQHQRELKRATRGDVEIEYVEVTIADIALANELAQVFSSARWMNWQHQCGDSMTNCGRCV